LALVLKNTPDKTVKGITHIFIQTCLFPAVLAGLISCDSKKPEGILSRDEMVQVMEELYIAEEKVNQLGLSRDSARQVFEFMDQKVFENAAIEDSIFAKSFDYYMEHPTEMELIYTALVDTLQLREQRAPFRPDQQ
jgi:hypothetical protein